MGLHVGQFRDLVIRPTLKAIGGPQDSEAAVQLLLATALHESRLEFLKQHPTGPALGVYQMEPATHDDHFRWLDSGHMREGRDGLPTRAVRAFDFGPYESDRLVYDVRYATAFARIHYWRIPEALPEAGDAAGMAAYWKRYYNTHLGAGTEDQFMAAWERNEAEIVA